VTEALKPVYWVGSSKKDLLQMPDEVIDDRIRERLKAAQEHAGMSK
jgi:hypothetical protein